MQDLLWLIAIGLSLKFIPKIIKGIKIGISEGITVVGRAIGWTFGILLLIFIITTLFI